MTELYKELAINTERMTELYKKSVKSTERMTNHWLNKFPNPPSSKEQRREKQVNKIKDKNITIIRNYLQINYFTIEVRFL